MKNFTNYVKFVPSGKQQATSNLEDPLMSRASASVSAHPPPISSPPEYTPSNETPSQKSADSSHCSSIYT